jgi:hypothetical protein
MAELGPANEMMLKWQAPLKLRINATMKDN